MAMSDRVKLTVGFATIGQGAGPMMVTWKSGLFEKYGFEVALPPLMGVRPLANALVRSRATLQRRALFIIYRIL